MLFHPCSGDGQTEGRHTEQSSVPISYLQTTSLNRQTDILFSITMRTIHIAGDEGMHDYGVLLANEEGKWLFSQLDDEGKETIFSEGFSGPLKALRILSEQGWDVVN